MWAAVERARAVGYRARSRVSGGGSEVTTLPRVAKPRMEVNISFRVKRELRDAAQAKAAERQENVSDVLREALERYVRSK